MFDAKVVKDSLAHHKHIFEFSVGMWTLLTGYVVYILYTQTKPEQRDLMPYQFLITTWLLANYEIGNRVINKVKALRDLEKQGHDAVKLAKEYIAFFDQHFKYRLYTNVAYFLSIGLSVPPMIKQAMSGDLPWSEVWEYMLFLAFLGTISGMVVMSLNYPFIIHTVSYTFSGIIVAVMSVQEHKMTRRLQKWKPKSIFYSKVNPMVISPLMV